MFQLVMETTLIEFVKETNKKKKTPHVSHNVIWLHIVLAFVINLLVRMVSGINTLCGVWKTAKK